MTESKIRIVVNFFDFVLQGSKYLPLPYVVKGMDVSFSGILSFLEEKLNVADLVWISLTSFYASHHNFERISILAIGKKIEINAQRCKFMLKCYQRLPKENTLLLISAFRFKKRSLQCSSRPPRGLWHTPDRKR